MCITYTQFIALESQAKQPMSVEVSDQRRSCVEYLWNSNNNWNLLLNSKNFFWDFLFVFFSFSYSSSERPQLRPVASGRQSHHLRVSLGGFLLSWALFMSQSSVSGIRSDWSPRSGEDTTVRTRTEPDFAGPFRPPSCIASRSTRRSVQYSLPNQLSRLKIVGLGPLMDITTLTY